MFNVVLGIFANDEHDDSTLPTKERFRRNGKVLENNGEIPSFLFNRSNDFWLGGKNLLVEEVEESITKFELKVFLILS